MDRRADPRVDVRLPCHVEFPSSKSSLFVGLTANMSRSGILVAWNAGLIGRLPKPGDLLGVDIELPAVHALPDGGSQGFAGRARRTDGGDAGEPDAVSQLQQRESRLHGKPG
jgi:hypothetical protein